MRFERDKEIRYRAKAAVGDVVGRRSVAAPSSGAIGIDVSLTVVRAFLCIHATLKVVNESLVSISTRLG